MPAKKSPPKSKIDSSTEVTRVVVNYDAGAPNNLYIRGQGADLDWKQGIPLVNVGTNKWVWESDKPFDYIEFKILVNDERYEEGSNRVVISGTAVEFIPVF